MDNSVVLPKPPMNICPEVDIQAGDPVKFTLADGRRYEGEIVQYLPDDQFIRIKLKERDKPVRVDLNTIKIMTFPKPRSWTRKDVGDQAIEVASDSQPFEIKFKDGTRVNGDTLGFRTDRYGVHLFPLTRPNSFIQTFSSKEVIQDYRVGDFLGEILVKDNLVTVTDISKVIQEQNEKRQQPLGEYLVSKAVVSREGLEQALKRQKTMPNMRLGEILVSENLVTEEQIGAALAEQTKDRKRPLGEILVEQGLVSQKEIQRSLAKKLGIPFVNLREYQIDPDIVGKLTGELVKQHYVIPLAMYESKLVVAIDNPMNWDALDAIKFHTGMLAEPVIATDEDINYAITFYYESKELFDSSIEDMAGGDHHHDDTPDKGEGNEDTVADNLVVKMINKIIMDAYKQKASDIHIEPYPGKNKTIVRFRKDGSLVKYVELPSQYKGALVSRIKVMAHLDISERRKPQDGKIDFKKFGPAKIELRVATLPTAGGLEDVVLRILAAGEPVPLEKLGLSPAYLERIKACVAKPYGLFLVCGPTGSGKTTTLHSILGYINTPDRKIWTAEDPVEITQRGMRQVQVLPKIGLTFAAAMRSFLRADPDVIMVGEMRDKETTSTGVEASLTGHLVFSTLHTNSAPESIVRLLDMGMDPFNFADALIAVVAQRLAKRLCKTCKQAYAPSGQELSELLEEYCLDMKSLTPEDKDRLLESWRKTYGNENGDLTLYKAVGCEECDKTGYAGRVGIHELLVASDTVKKAIIEHAMVSRITELAIGEGMRTLKQDGIEKVLQGITDISRIRAVCSK